MIIIIIGCSIKIISEIVIFMIIYVCFITIEAVPIFKSNILGLLFGQIIPIYSIIMLISYAIVSKFYQRGDAPVFGVILYAIVYIPLALLLWGILSLLTFIKVLPV